MTPNRHWRVLPSLTLLSLNVLLLWPTLCLAQEASLPLPAPAEEQDKLWSQAFVQVREFVFEGNTVFSDDELAPLLKSYLDRRLTSEDLEEARRTLTLHYVSNGYINSGAILPNQTVQDGVILFRLVEGVLSEIEVRGTRRLRSSYISNRALRGSGGPLNLDTLQNSLEPLRQNPLLKRINAELRPGVLPGESHLELQVEEAFPIQLGLQFSNQRPPSIGAEQLQLFFAHQNLGGWGDRVQVEYGLTKNGLGTIGGLAQIDASYMIPLSRHDTTLELAYSQSDNLVIEEPFDNLDISSEYHAYGFTVRHPFYRSPRTEFSMNLTGERRLSEAFLFGRPFSFSRGAQKGKSDVTVLRFAQEFFTRSASRAIAARSSLSLGVDILGPTNNPHGIPDGQFLVWLGQFQYVQSLSGKTQLVSRLNMQLAADPLLSIEQFSLGGLDTVRGYRENQLVRDNGVASSFELRLPVLFDQFGNGTLFIDPFFDFGYGWSVGGSPDGTFLSSVGIGMLFNPNRHLDLKVYWGYALQEFNTSEGNLQDLGLHFLVNFYTF